MKSILALLLLCCAVAATAAGTDETPTAPAAVNDLAQAIAAYQPEGTAQK